MSTTSAPVAANEQIDAVDRGMVRLLGVVLVVVTLLVFHRVVGFKLLTWDDDQHIVENPYFNPLSWKNMLRFWTHAHIYLYIPISYSFFGFEVAVAQLWPSTDPADKFNPAVFHLGNLLIHTTSVLLVYRLLLRLVRHAPAACAGALLFAIHPLQVESVAWVGETRGTLAAMFSLLALTRYLDYVGVDPQHGLFATTAYRPASPRRRDYAIATLYFALALLSKPSAASLPLLALIVEVVLLRHPWRGSLRRLALWLALSAAISVLTKIYQKTELLFAPDIVPWYRRPLLVGDTYAFYLRKLVAPFDLAFDYGRTPAAAATTWEYAWAWILPVGVAALLALGGRRRIGLGGYALFLAALVPVSGIVPFIYQSISTVADRYMYVPLVGIGLLLAAWIASRRSSGWAFAASAVVLGAMIPRTAEQTELWRDDVAVYQQGLKVNPRSFMARLSLGNLERRSHNYNAAIDHYRRMLEIRPDYFSTQTLIGLSYLDGDRPAEAIPAFEAALAAQSDNHDALCGLGRARAALDEWPAAESAYRRAMKADPKSAEPLLLLGELFAKQQRRENDVDAPFAAAIQLDDRALQSRLRYGRALIATDRFAEAAKQLEQAVEIAPDSAAARYELAAAYYRQGKFAQAIVQAEGALRARPGDFGALQTLGLAQAAVGRNAEAAETLAQALAQAPPASPQAAAVRDALAQIRQ